MSHTATGRCEIRSKESLISALQEMGIEPVVHVTPHQVEDYRGRLLPEVAHIIIPRDQLKKINAGNAVSYAGHAYNEIGLFERPDGGFDVVSDFHQTQNGKTWLGKLTALVGLHAAERAMKKRGRKTERIKDSAGAERLRVFA